MVRFDKTAARANVENRNRVREEAGIALVVAEQEIEKLRLVYEDARRQEFLSGPLRERVSEKMLARFRRRIGDPYYVPTGVLSAGGFAFKAAVTGQMRRLYRRLRGKTRGG